MLKTLELHNFKSHRSTKLTFDHSRLHALVGANGAGKTSVLKSIFYLNKYLRRNLSKNEDLPEATAKSGCLEFSIKAQGVYKDSDSHRRWEKTCAFQYDRQDDKWILEDDPLAIVGKIPWGTHPKRKFLKNTRYLKLVAANLVNPSYSDAVVPKLAIDGEGLAPALDHLRNEDPERFQTLQTMVRRIVPGVQKVRIRRAKVSVNRQRFIEVDGKSISYMDDQEVMGQEVVLDMDTGDRLPAHAISEGTMLALGLLTVLMHPSQPDLVLLDDIEQGLHPKAQRELMGVFKEIVQDNPDLQIIFSTHSPYIVDELAPSQVHVLSIDSSGMTQTKRLDEHPDAEWAKQTLSTGEFWNAEGEDWVIAG